ncbi:hypothetical protein SARC_03698 [Sphaeroforma arctica JP610]|uniref:Protein phosphatase methylesterase 1 n=1 Tax=Sphaeroforma arctica JP610 TaxID=667725 RepID=A0A0L0G4Y0_9EUKA|nr:hypothetical protein SARC_03698 [Sphaeroforma arctica JP610]KNC84070.1 hypothetical protein SARC_03698 [Sphaeroforma arctica JP610]|eukprot:XP_014157972.1 hypothetical protein SARC_03698 [Sphaeroforma arctica JP610]
MKVYLQSLICDCSQLTTDPRNADTVYNLPDRDELEMQVYSRGSKGLCVLLLHGGGYSGLTWACMTKQLNSMVEVQVVAPDIRGHGGTRCAQESKVDKATQCEDIAALIKLMFGTTPPPVLVVGHSMGGAIAIHLANGPYLATLAGLVVIDVVEGTAIEALGHMSTILENRPSIFRSMEYAIEWSIRSHHVRNIEAARVSMPGQLVTVAEHKRISRTHVCAPSDQTDSQPSGTKPISTSIRKGITGIVEEEEEEDESAGASVEGHVSTTPAADSQTEPIQAQSDKLKDKYDGPALKLGLKAMKSSVDSSVSDGANGKSSERFVWRTDLLATEPYWRGWFEGISHLFLGTSVAKLLVLGGIDRMDTEMSVAHMQGKYQLKVMSSVGHVVHEDTPDRVAECLAEFIVRNRLATPLDGYKGLRPVV